MRWKRILLIPLAAWLPLLLLNTWIGHQEEGGIFLSFSRDISVHVRLLVTLPVMLAMEGVYRRRLSLLVEETKVILPPDYRVRLEQLVDRMNRVSGSKYTILAILVAGYFFLFFSQGALGDQSAGSWKIGSEQQVTPAGWWYYLISMPVFLFLLLRWIYRWAMWSYLIFWISSSPIKLIPEHADQMGGLEYMNYLPGIFSVVLGALAAIVSSHMAVEIRAGKVLLPSIYFEIGAFCILGVLLAYAPLLFFVPKLNESKVSAIKDYGSLIRDHHTQFREKWFGAKPAGQILGSGDPSSKADIDGSYQPLQRMQLIPVNMRSLRNSLIYMIIPFVPLVFLKYSLIEVINRIIQILGG